MECPAVAGTWTRVRTLGCGASGAEVFLAADEASGQLLAVKSVSRPGAAALMREQAVMAGLRSPHVVPCVGGRARRDGSYDLFLEFAPGGSLADAAARHGGRLEERDVRRYAADVAAGLAHVHGAGVVHGDVKPRNVVLGADGRAKLADFGCARKVAGSSRTRSPIGGTPAFMAPEVARGEDQGPAADVWALGCTVVEIATGRAPWSHVVDDVIAAVRIIGYTDAVPEVPNWLSADAKDFLRRCLARRASDRPTAAELLQHPFLVSYSTGCDADATPLEVDSIKRGKWVSPKSTLDAALWESTDTDDEDDDDVTHSAAARIESLVCSVSTMPADWDSDDEGWIEVIATPSEPSSDAEMPAPTEGKVAIDSDVDSGDGTHDVGETDASPEHEGHPHSSVVLACQCDDEDPCKLLQCDTNNAMDFVRVQMDQMFLCSPRSLNSEILFGFRVLCFFLFFFSNCLCFFLAQDFSHEHSRGVLT